MPLPSATRVCLHCGRVFGGHEERLEHQLRRRHLQRIPGFHPREPADLEAGVELEKRHVHAVYEDIAPHFSRTRASLWYPALPGRQPRNPPCAPTSTHTTTQTRAAGSGSKII